MGFDIQTIFDVSNELEYRLKKDKNIEINDVDDFEEIE